MSTKAKITQEGLLIPKEVAERALGQGLEEVEIFEEPGRLLISPTGGSGQAEEEGEDPILALGEDPVEDVGATDASVNHDLQRRELVEFGCDRIFEEQISFRKADRTELRAALGYGRETSWWCGSSTGSGAACGS